MKVKEMSFADAKTALAGADSKLQQAAGKLNAKDVKSVEALRAAAINFARAERDARTARDREAKASLGSLL